MVMTTLGAVACKDDRQLIELRDTEGRRFKALCDLEGTCKLKQSAGPKWPGDAAHFRLESPGRLVGICTLEEESEEVLGSECRALTCDKGSNCPPLLGMKEGSCVAGHCVNATHDVTARDAVLMCLKGLGLGENTNEQADRFALALNCGQPCQIPKVCDALGLE